MIRRLVLLVTLAAGPAQASLPHFAPSSCENMCEKDSDCSSGAECMRVRQFGRCGLCVCVGGYTSEGTRCRKSPSTAAAVLKYEERPVSDLRKPDAVLDHWSCPALVCPSNKNPQCDWAAVARPVSCGPESCAGGGVCADVGGAELCVCPPSRQGVDCSRPRPSRGCEEANGRRVRVEAKGRRFVHPRGEDSASVLSRHFVANLDHCRRLCRWAGTQSCRSLNYLEKKDGNGVCELLKVWAQEDYPLNVFVKEAPGWEYHCCFGPFQQQNNVSRFSRSRTARTTRNRKLRRGRPARSRKGSNN